MIIIKSDREIDILRQANRIVAQILEKLKEYIKPGVSTAELDRIAEEFIRSAGAEPAFKGYRGYPATICASVNEEVVHGIPRADKKLKEGDIISIDVGVRFKGYYGDAAATYPVGEVSELARKLIEVTREALYRGIEKAQAGCRLHDISYAIQSFVEGHGFSVVREFVGHGIGAKMHEDPQIPNFGVPGTGPRLKKGMVLAIEPMVNVGGHEVDRSLSAHFEHSVAVGEDGAEILSVLGD